MRLSTFIQSLFASSLAILASLLAPAAAGAERARSRSDGIELRRVALAAGGSLQLAIARPPRARGAPAVLILHGTHGFAEEYVALARDFARAGFVAVAACWFRDGSGQGRRFIEPLACPEDTPGSVEAASDDAQARVDALVQAVTNLPDVSPGQVVLFGHSRGGGAALNHALRGGAASAVILHSTGYPPELGQRLDQLRIPLLILHGERDTLSDGGSAMTAPARARAFEAALKQKGGPVTSRFFPQGGHNGIFADPRLWREVLSESVRFARRWTGYRDRKQVSSIGDEDGKVVLAPGLVAVPDHRKTIRVVAPPSTPAGFRPLFNGADLKGWRVSRTSNHGSTPLIMVRDGMIIATQNPAGRGGLLVSEESFGDFELHVEARSDWGNDSGLLFRVTEAGAGYQVTLDTLPCGSIGRLEGVGGVRMAHQSQRPGPSPPCVEGDAGQAVWRRDDWNVIRIRVEGAVPKVSVSVNGLSLPVLSDDVNRAVNGRTLGPIALQIHGGASRWQPGGFWRWRSIAIKELR